MKILCLNGSPRGRDGNTQKMVNAFFQGAESAGAESSTIYAKDLSVGFCKGCFACWTVTPGRCVQRDDMDMVLEALSKADAVIWATPLYHYGMTAMLKAVMERTLPMADPHIIKKEGICCHPMREGRDFLGKTLLFSNCGFPEFHHFDGLLAQFKCLLKGRSEGPDEVILRPEGEMLRVAEMSPHLVWYYDALRQAGREFVSKGKISAGVHESLKRDLVPVDLFISRANEHWDRCIERGTMP